MKTRNGFVSNSSTSSFICDFCGEVEAGMDLCLDDVGMIACRNGHEFHIDCAGKYSKKIEKYLEGSNKDEDNEDESDEDRRYEADPSVCPFCQLDKLTQKDELGFRRLENPESEESILNRIKDKYKTYEAFKKVIKKGEKG